MSLVLDAGALIGIDRGDRRVGALLRVAQQERLPLRTSAAAVAQVWRDGARQARLARLLAGIDTVALDVTAAKRLGTLLGVARTADVVDAHVASLARTGDRVLTSDPADLRHLLDRRAVGAVVVQV